MKVNRSINDDPWRSHTTLRRRAVDTREIHKRDAEMASPERERKEDA
jgi:hypothetical protein